MINEIMWKIRGGSTRNVGQKMDKEIELQKHTVYAYFYIVKIPKEPGIEQDTI